MNTNLKSELLYRSIRYFGLERCDFDDECDTCDDPADSYCAMTSGPGYTEVDYFICSNCLMKKYKITLKSLILFSDKHLMLRPSD
jgi:hypothetical protein